MSEEHSEKARRRDHLRVVHEPAIELGAGAARPRTIGRLIAQTALIADSALQRRRDAQPNGAAPRGRSGRIFGRFRQVEP